MKNITYCWSEAPKEELWSGEDRREERKKGEWEDSLDDLKPKKSRNIFQCGSGLLTQATPLFNF